MNASLTDKTYPFLQGGGEMGALTRQYDWSKTSLGTPDQWPQSLRTTVSNLLRSRFPKFLWWGPDMIQFYNDAYRPSLGNEGKHPKALGQRGEECWPEIWHIISPLHRQVEETGEATWMENMLVPIYRNGKIEDVYWTFSYSSVLDDEGRHGGILVTCMETTEAVKAQQQKEENHQALVNLFEESPVGIANVSADEDLVFQSANSFYGQLVDRLPADLIGKPLFKALPELIGQGFEKLLSDAIATGTPYSAYEVPVDLKRKGRMERIYVDLAYQPRKANGKVHGLMIVATDVTQQVEARKKIEERELKYRSLFQSMNQGFCILEMIFDEKEQPLDYRFLEINHQFEEQTGLKDAIGKTARQLVPNLEQHWFELYGNVALTGEPANFVQGSEAMGRWFDVHAFRLEDGSRRKVALLFSDITERMLTRRKIEETNSALQEAIELAELATWSMDIKSRTFHYSPRFMEWLGFSEDTKSIDEAYNPLPDEYRQQVADAIEAVIQPGSPGVYRNEHPIINRLTGQQRIILAQALVSKDADGNPITLSGTARDVTKEREMQTELEYQVKERTEQLRIANEQLLSTNEELAAANRLLGQNNRELEQFAYVASHDLQEPLRKVSTFTDMLKIHLGETADQRTKTFLEKIGGASTRMLQLIRDVLDFSQLSTEREVFEPVKLDELLHNLVSDFELVIEQKGALVEVNNLPTLEANALQMRQLFGNLLSNALKFTKEGVAPEISIMAAPLPDAERAKHKDLLADKKYYLITVKDNGIGFEQEYAEKIFSIFQRLNAKSEFDGTGIGLALCKKIVQNHHGEIRAVSEKNNGSLFKIVLPAEQK